jgi:predicted Zn-dependent peptidase
VGAKHTEATMTEINYEVNRLREELVSVEELDLVKNYTAGDLLRNFDGTFSQASLIQTMLTNQLPESYYSDFLNKIYTIEPADVLRVAQKYFDLEKFTIAIVGDGFSDNA